MAVGPNDDDLDVLINSGILTRSNWGISKLLKFPPEQLTEERLSRILDDVLAPNPDNGYIIAGFNRVVVCELAKSRRLSEAQIERIRDVIKERFTAPGVEVSLSSTENAVLVEGLAGTDIMDQEIVDLFAGLYKPNDLDSRAFHGNHPASAIFRILRASGYDTSAMSEAAGNVYELRR